MKLDELNREDFNLIWREISNGYLGWEYRKLLAEIVKESESQAVKFLATILIGFLRRMDDEVGKGGKK